MGGLFGGGKTKSDDGGANAFAMQMANQSREEARRAEERSREAQNQLKAQQERDAAQRAEELKKQQDEVNKLQQAEKDKEIAASKQTQAQNVTGTAGIDFNALNKGALALQGQKNTAAFEKQSNLDRLKNQNIYGTGGFNFAQAGGQRSYR